MQYIKARQNYTLALQQLNILMGVKPDAAVDSLCEIGMHCPPVDLLSLDEVLSRRADYAGTHVSIARSEAQRKAALSQYNPQLSMFLATGWDTGIAYMGQDVPHTPIAGINLNIPIFRWGARFKTNRQQKAYIGIQNYSKAMWQILFRRAVRRYHQTDGNGTAGKDSPGEYGACRRESRPGYVLLQ